MLHLTGQKVHPLLSSPLGPRHRTRHPWLCFHLHLVRRAISPLLSSGEPDTQEGDDSPAVTQSLSGRALLIPSNESPKICALLCSQPQLRLPDSEYSKPPRNMQDLPFTAHQQSLCSLDGDGHSRVTGERTETHQKVTTALLNSVLQHPSGPSGSREVFLPNRRARDVDRK